VGYQVRKRVERARVGDADAAVRFLVPQWFSAVGAFVSTGRGAFFLRPASLLAALCRTADGLLLVLRIPGVLLVTIAKVEREFFGSEQNYMYMYVYLTELCWRKLKSSVTDKESDI